VTGAGGTGRQGGTGRTGGPPDRTRNRAVQALAPTYRDAITVVAQVVGEVGDAWLTSLSGGNLAIEALIEGGWLWVTDEDDAFFGEREHESGWSVAVYPGTPDTNETHHQRVFLSAHGTDLSILRQLLVQALHTFATTRTS
jgi:hypothetical protein